MMVHAAVLCMHSNTEGGCMWKGGDNELRDETRVRDEKWVRDEKRVRERERERDGEMGPRPNAAARVRAQRRRCWIGIVVMV